MEQQLINETISTTDKTIPTKTIETHSFFSYYAPWIFVWFYLFFFAVSGFLFYLTIAYPKTSGVAFLALLPLVIVVPVGIVVIIPFIMIYCAITIYRCSGQHSFSYFVPSYVCIGMGSGYYLYLYAAYIHLFGLR